MACKDKNIKGSPPQIKRCLKYDNSVASLDGKKECLLYEGDIPSSTNSSVSSQKDVQEKVNEQSAQALPLPRQTIVSTDKAFAVGKKLIVIDKTSYGPSMKEREDGITVSIEGENIIDPFRLSSAKYWTVSEDEQNIIYLNSKEASLHQIGNYNFQKGVLTLEDIKLGDGLKSVLNRSDRESYGMFDQMMALMTPQRDISQQTVFSTQQWISINPIAKYFEDDVLQPDGSLKKVFNDGKWKEYVESTVAMNRGFYDYSFEMSVPFYAKDIEKRAFLVQPLVYDYDFHYNFYVKEYEEKIQSVPERSLPNFYVFQSEMSREQNHWEHLKMITLGGSLEPKDAILISPSSMINYQKVNSNYFSLYAYTLEKALRAGMSTEANRQKIQNLADMNNQHLNIGIPIEKNNILNDFYSQKVMFPMYVDMQFSTDKTTVIANVLKDCRLDKMLMKDIVMGNGNKEKLFVEATETAIQEQDGLGGSFISKAFSFSNSPKRTWDISEWIMNIKDSPPPSSLEHAIIFEDNNESGEDNEIVKSLMRIIFVGKMKKFLKSKFRTYEEMMSGKPAYSETVMYRVAKSFADENGNIISDVIQDYYISNGNEIELLKLVDTQVKYNVRYRYDVFAYQLVIGTKYAYSDLTQPTARSAPPNASFSVTQTPSVLVIEVPYCNFYNVMLDAPPVRPDIQIIPYKGIDNKLLMFFNGNVGSYLEKPIPIDAEDKAKIDEYYRAKRIPSQEPIVFRSDDHSSVFQIFRMETPPKEYSDFAGKLLATVQTDVSTLTAQSATSAAFIDNIKPNMKYWYCYRSVDNHGHISQPSEIYQVEMVNDHGTIYPVVELFDMEKNREKKDIAKPLRRYIYIAPTMLQSIIDEEKSGLQDLESVKKFDPGKVVLGVEEKTVWGNSYKIRVTSKKTGKKVDINVMCDHKGVKKEESVL